MKPKEIAVALGGHDYDTSESVLASLGPDSGDEVARAIRDGFEGGDEQGNGRRLTALVKIQGDGALDVIRDVLEDTVEVGGPYSNLRNLALELIRDHFFGNRSLEKSLWRAHEIDEYMDMTLFAELVMPFDPERASALLIEEAKQGVPVALQALAKNARPKLLEILDAALAKDSANQFVESLGGEAFTPDIAEKLRPHVETLPAAATVVASSDVGIARQVAEKISSKEHAWQRAAVRAIDVLPAKEIFERVSPLLEANDRAKPKGLAKLDLLWQNLSALEDPRWLDRLCKLLDEEESPKVRECLVRLLALVGPSATDAILAAPRDDKDSKVIDAMVDALYQVHDKKPVVEKVRAALESVPAKGKRAKTLRRVLSELEQ